MGKQYQTELDALLQTIAWARDVNLSPFVSAMTRARCGDLLVVASGGSLSAAWLLAQLHQSCTTHVASVMTPLEFATDSHPVAATVVFLSAGGNNRDILNGWAAALRRGCRELIVVCGATDSKLVSVAKEQEIKGLISFDLPIGRDGFLATNSLAAFFCILLRLYEFAVPPVLELPDISDLLPLLDRDELVVLYAGWMKPIAIDIESRFVEAALKPIFIADYRNFAHGRHHWIAKRGARS